MAATGKVWGLGTFTASGTGGPGAEGEMSAGGCLFSLAGREAVSNPPLGCFQSPLGSANSPVAVRSPRFCSGGSQSTFPGGLSRELAFI
jgi:hypothetical protein